MNWLLCRSIGWGGNCQSLVVALGASWLLMIVARRTVDGLTSEDIDDTTVFKSFMHTAGLDEEIFQKVDGKIPIVVELSLTPGVTGLVDMPVAE